MGSIAPQSQLKGGVGRSTRVESACSDRFGPTNACSHRAPYKDFRYQLTIVGTRGWRARLVKKVSHNRFTIQTDMSRVEVSWQVTGVRHDPYANEHRIQVVVPTTGADAGRYAHPRLYGEPASKGVDAAVGPPRQLPKLHARALKARALPQK